jgi:DNA-binding transcriptional LysR family regulator
MFSGLEERLGVRLLHRTMHRISLTEAGAACYRHCTRIEPSAVYAVYPSNRLMSAKVRAFVDHLARRIGRTPYVLGQGAMRTHVH